MDVFLMIRREKATIYVDATEETTVAQLKRILQGIIKKPTEDQRLYNIGNNEILDDVKTLGDCGYRSLNTKAQDPGTIGLAYRTSDGEFEEGAVTPYSSPPELPEVMKAPESSATAND